MKKDTYYELNEDFSEVKTIFIEEVLTEEDLKEGLEPMILDTKVALTSHAVDRMNERDISWDEIEYSLIKVGDSLLELKNGERFNVLVDETFSIAGNAHFQDGDLVLIVKTVIRIEDKNGNYKKVHVKEEDTLILFFNDEQ